MVLKAAMFYLRCSFGKEKDKGWQMFLLKSIQPLRKSIKLLLNSFLLGHFYSEFFCANNLGYGLQNNRLRQIFNIHTFRFQNGLLRNILKSQHLLWEFNVMIWAHMIDGYAVQWPKRSNLYTSGCKGCCRCTTIRV